jgi:KDO2-lipid IV(A) lauroyltransferase
VRLGSAAEPGRDPAARASSPRRPPRPRAGGDTWRWRASYWIFRAIVGVGRWLPTRLCYAIAEPIARVCYVFFRGHRRSIVENLTRVLADRDRARAAGRRVFPHFSKYVIDFFQVPARGSQHLMRRVDYGDWERLDALVREGRGVIFVTVHLGQFEAGIASVAGKGYPVSVVADTFAHAPMNDLVQGLRRNLGLRVIPGETAALGAVRALRRGEVLGLLLDVVPPGQEVEVDFFGAKAVVSALPARLALMTGARIVTAVAPRDPVRTERLVPEIDYDIAYAPTEDRDDDVAALTQRLAASIEGFVHRYPDQWFAFRPVWRGERSGGAGWEFWTLELSIHLLGWLPRRPAYALAWLIGTLAYYLRRGMRADVESNMGRVLGPAAPAARVRAAAREVVRNVCRYYADLILLRRMRPESLLRERFTVHGLDNVMPVLEKGRGSVVATAHFGNPEMAVQVAPLLGLDPFVLSEPLEPRRFSDLVHALRAVHGLRYEEVGYRAMRNAIRHLRRGGSVAITCDRDIQGTGLDLTFFGRETRLPLGAVELAYRTGAALIPAYCRRRRGGYDLVFEPPVPLAETGDRAVDVRATARALLGRVEAWVRSDPGQWFVLERVWDRADGPEG